MVYGCDCEKPPGVSRGCLRPALRLLPVRCDLWRQPLVLASVVAPGCKGLFARFAVGFVCGETAQSMAWLLPPSCPLAGRAFGCLPEQGTKCPWAAAADCGGARVRAGCAGPGSLMSGNINAMHERSRACRAFSCVCRHTAVVVPSPPKRNLELSPHINGLQTINTQALTPQHNTRRLERGDA